MAHKIWKFNLQFVSEQTVKMPNDAQFLVIQKQGNYLVIWVRIDPDAPFVDYDFYMYGTGFDCDPPVHSIFLGTIQENNNPLVWHFFGNGQFKHINKG